MWRFKQWQEIQKPDLSTNELESADCGGDYVAVARPAKPIWKFFFFGQCQYGS